MKQQNGKNKLKYKSKTSGLAKAVLCAVSGAVVSVAAGALLFPEKMLGLVSNAFIGPKIDAENIDFEKNRLVLTNVKVLGDDGIEMINSPKIVIDYSLKDRKITNLKSFGGHLNIVAYNNDYDLNVVNEFVKKQSKKIEKLEDYKVGIDTVIDRIEAEDMTVSFIDQSYKEEIKIDAHDVNGTVTFSKTEGIAVDVKGLRNQNENIEVIFSDKEQPYCLNLKGNNISIDNNVGRYILDLPGLTYKDGRGNIDLVISWKGLFGKADLKDALLRYKYLDDDIKVKDAQALFDGKIVVDFGANVLLFDKLRKIEGSYRDGKLSFPIFIDDIEAKHLAKIEGVKDLDLSQTKSLDAKINLATDIEDKFYMDLDLISKEENEINSVKFKDIKLNLVNDSDKDFMEVKLHEMPVTVYGIDKKLKAVYTDIDKKQHLDFSLKSKNIKDLLPNIIINADILNQEKTVKADIKSNIIDTNLNYDKNTKVLTLSQEKYKIIYNTQEKTFQDSQGHLDIKLFNTLTNLNYKVRNNIIDFENIEVKEKNNKKLLYGNAKLDVLNYIFDSSLNFDNFKFEKKFNDENMTAFLNGKFNLNIENKNLKIDGNLKNSNIDYLANFKNINGEYKYFYKDKKYEINTDLIADEITYEDYNLKAVNFKLNYLDDILKIINVGNDIIIFKGELNPSNKNSSIDFVVKDFTNKELKQEHNFGLTKAHGSIKGDVSNPLIEAVIDDAFVSLNENKNIKVNGKLFYKDKILKANKIYLEKNELTATYNIDNKEYSGNLKIIEDNILNYTNSNISAQYSADGNISFKGKEKIVEALISAHLLGKNDKINIPNIVINGDYKSNDLVDGIIDLKTISLQDENKNEIIPLNAKINLKDKSLSGKSQTIIDGKKLASLLQNDEYKQADGKIVSNFNLSGTIDEPKYDLTMTSDKLIVKGEELNKFILLLDGNAKELNLRNFSFLYRDNKLTSNGKYDIKNDNYLFNAKSDVIDLGFLKAFDKKNFIDKIGGKANFNININKNGLSGYANANFFNMDIKKYNLKFGDFSSRLKMLNNTIEIEKFEGKLNDGNAKINGYVNIPDLKDIDLATIHNKSNYYFNVKVKDMNYNMPDTCELLIDSNMELSPKQLVGDVIIQKGKIEDIPSEYKNILTIMKNFLFKSSYTTTKEEKNKEEDVLAKEKAKLFLAKLMPVNLILTIREPIDISVDKYNLVVGEINGQLRGSLNLRGSDSKYTLLGDFELINGHVVINNNDFDLTRALVVFGDRNTYLPDLNPNIFIESVVNLKGEDVSFDINGKLDNLRFTMLSSEGRSSGSLNSLLINDSNLDGGDNKAYLELMRSMAEGQVVQTVFSPFTRKIKKLFNFSKFRINSNANITHLGSNINRIRDAAKLDEIRFGTVLEAETNLYKNRFFLNAEIELFDLTAGIFNKKKDDQSNIRQYDVNLEYRWDNGKSLGVGVGTVPYKYIEEGEYEAQEKWDNKKNYHIDFKIRKKYDNIFDVLKF